jgi:hypothetical protein
MSGQQGAVYGNICASCRKTAAEKSALPEESADSTTSTTGHRIDAKAKVQSEIDKRQWRKELEILNHEEREKDEEDKLKHLEKSQTIRAREKDHHARYKSSLLSAKPKIPAKASTVFGGIQQTAKEAEIDLATGPFRDTEIAGKVKYAQSAIFQQFKSWLGNSAPIVHAERVAKGALSATQKKAENPPKVEAEENESAAAEYVRKTWGPK